MSELRTILVAQRALNRLGPRARRAEYVSEALEDSWLVARWPVSAPAGDASGSASLPARLGRATAGAVARNVLIDRVEPAMRRAVRRMPRGVDAALLIGPPFSTIGVAAAELSQRGVPYVIDVGDPWALTRESWEGGRANRRARSSERSAWEGASGSILTTEGQAQALRRLFPAVPILVRPNGYEPVPSVAPSDRRRTVHSDELRLVYYGSLYDTYSASSLRSFFSALTTDGGWTNVTLTHYGRDWHGALAEIPDAVRVDRRSPLPWAEIVSTASEFDLALVIGHRDSRKLPSKAVQYLTLPIPRLALCETRDDSLANYVQDKPGYLVISADEGDGARRIRSWISKGNWEDDLLPPPGESWDHVAPQIADFVATCVTRGG